MPENLCILHPLGNGSSHGVKMAFICRSAWYPPPKCVSDECQMRVRFLSDELFAGLHGICRDRSLVYTTNVAMLQAYLSQSCIQDTAAIFARDYILVSTLKVAC